jgi:hypothetical protein
MRMITTCDTIAETHDVRSAPLDLRNPTVPTSASYTTRLRTTATAAVSSCRRPSVVNSIATACGETKHSGFDSRESLSGRSARAGWRNNVAGNVERDIGGHDPIAYCSTCEASHSACNRLSAAFVQPWTKPAPAGLSDAAEGAVRTRSRWLCKRRTK